MAVIDVSRGDKKLVEYLKPEIKKVLLSWGHGIGDAWMSKPVLKSLREQFPNIQFDVGVFRGLGMETIFPDAVFIEGEWRELAEQDKYRDYDFVFSWNFPLERQEDLSKTKAEISCIDELGIAPVSGYEQTKAKPLIAVHYQMTSIPWVANATYDVGKQIWEDIIAAGCVPIECDFQHVFHNPENEKFDFVDTHMRACAAKMDTLIALLGACYAGIFVVSGNFHTAMSVMPNHRVMLLERDLKRELFTKVPIATANLKNYKGEVKEWLLSITKHR